MNTSLKAGLVSALALLTAAPALAQDYRPTDQYQRDSNRYEDQRADYQDQQRAYQDQQREYQDARRDYDRRRDDYEAARAAYDNRYGYGAYSRRYGPAPTWDEARWAGRYGDNASYRGAYDDACRNRRSSNSIAGGLIGALAGAALGSNVAARNARTEGAVLGAVVGGAAGVAVGRSSANCDDRGYYYSYDQTIPYRESGDYRGRRSGRYDYSYYSRQRCRLAPAPVDAYNGEYRYVRVCPDRNGRYRFTG